MVFEDALQVRGQKETRQHKQGVEQKLTDLDGEKTKTPAIQTDIVILEKKDGGFEYITAPINDRGHEAIPLPALVKSRVIQEYGKEVKPLPVVAITDGAKVIRRNYSATHSVPGIQGRPVNTERRTSRTRWPCLRAVEI